MSQDSVDCIAAAAAEDEPPRPPSSSSSSSTFTGFPGDPASSAVPNDVALDDRRRRCLRAACCSDGALRRPPPLPPPPPRGCSSAAGGVVIAADAERPGVCGPACVAVPAPPHTRESSESLDTMSSSSSKENGDVAAAAIGSSDGEARGDDRRLPGWLAPVPSSSRSGKGCEEAALARRLTTRVSYAAGETWVPPEKDPV